MFVSNSKSIVLLIGIALNISCNTLDRTNGEYIIPTMMIYLFLSKQYIIEKGIMIITCFVFSETSEDESGSLSAVDFQNAQNKSFLEPTTRHESIFNNLTDTNLFEGDIEVDHIDDFENEVFSFNDFVSNNDYKWNNRSGPFLKLPYTLPSGLSTGDKAQIARAVWEFRSKTCVK